MPRLFLSLLLSLGIASSASGVTFDFATFPDSAGCDRTVAVAEVPDPAIDVDVLLEAGCDAEWVIEDYQGGNVDEHVQTIDGLTLTLGGDVIDWGYYGERIDCGNSPDGDDFCGPFIATFSSALASITIDYETRQAPPGYETSYYVTTYTGPGGTGNVIDDAVIVGNLAGPILPFMLFAPDESQLILSASFGMDIREICAPDAEFCDVLAGNGAFVEGYMRRPCPSPGRRCSWPLVCSASRAGAGRAPSARASGSSPAITMRGPPDRSRVAAIAGVALDRETAQPDKRFPINGKEYWIEHAGDDTHAKTRWWRVRCSA